MFRGGSLWTGVALGALSQWRDTAALRNQTLDQTQYRARTTKNVTGALGIMGGVEAGAILGTAIFPGVGTVAGSVVGAFVGDRIGSFVGTQANQLWNRNDQSPAHNNGTQMDTSLMARPMQQ